jgi:hypothetical protein
VALFIMFAPIILNGAHNGCIMKFNLKLHIVFFCIVYYAHLDRYDVSLFNTSSYAWIVVFDVSYHIMFDGKFNIQHRI